MEQFTLAGNFMQWMFGFSHKATSWFFARFSSGFMLGRIESLLASSVHGLENNL